MPKTKDGLGLTERQAAIVTALGEHFELRDLAAHFQLSVFTIKHHITALLDITGCANRHHLTLWGVRHGYIKFETDTSARLPQPDIGA